MRFVVEVFSVVLPSLKSTTADTQLLTTQYSLIVIFYSLLDYGNGLIWKAVSVSLGMGAKDEYEW